LKCAAARHAFEPSELLETIQNPGCDDSFQVIAPFAPVEAGLAENPTCRGCHIGAERGKETSSGRRDFTAFIGELDVSHGYESIGDGDAYLAGQMIVATSGKP